MDAEPTLGFRFQLARGVVGNVWKDDRLWQSKMGVGRRQNVVREKQRYFGFDSAARLIIY